MFNNDLRIPHNLFLLVFFNIFVSLILTRQAHCGLWFFPAVIGDLTVRQRHFREMLETQWSRGNFVCVGLDSELGKIPVCVGERVRESYADINNTYFGDCIFEFNQGIVGKTKDLVCAYKPNAAFYEAEGAVGLDALQRTIEMIHEVAPDVPVILDAKRADIGNTNNGYVEMAFDYLGADAITVHPYLGAEALAPFLAREEKGIIVLCRTSNPGAREFQDIQVQGGSILIDDEPTSRPLYQVVAQHVATHWNKNGNCAVVVGATYPIELAEVRKIVGDMPILIPGVGAQGGDVESMVKAGKDSRDCGMIINSSRGIIFASNGDDYAEAARRETVKLRDLINQHR